MEFGFPGHVLTLDSILEGILQDESTSSSSSDSSRPTHLSLDNIPDALPIKEEKEEGNTVDIMVRFLLAQFGHFGQNSKLPKTQTCPSCPNICFYTFWTYNYLNPKLPKYLPKSKYSQQTKSCPNIFYAFFGQIVFGHTSI